MKKEYLSLKGIHTVTKSRLTDDAAWDIQAELVRLESEGRYEEFKELLTEFNKEYGVESFVVENVTPTEGRTEIARALTGDLSAIAEIEINYVALGDDNTAENIADTALGNEVFRKQFSSRTHTDNIAYVTAFYTTGDTDGTYEEHGLFINGGAGADSGSIISRLLLGGLVKSAIETLTIDTAITINDA
jgi:hypothetical protein|tara:strand:+ start:28873 stop:29439 length:567 start_codon:yes stop_codon:yes gene_type:complete